MNDEPTNGGVDETSADAEESAPQDAEAPVAESDASTEQPATEQPDAEQSDAEQPDAEQPDAEQPDDADSEQGEQPESEPAGQPSEPAEAADSPPADRPKAKDQPPGAELEPIAIEPERELGAEERARLEAEAEERARLEAQAEAGEEPVARSGPQVAVPAEARIQATGKRKSSIARVVLRAGDGGFEVNGRPLDEYFPRQNLRTVARQPLLTAGYESTVNVSVRVHGGGISGQAGAVRHGVARALCEIDPELRSELKRRGLLTRDARKKERRKAGLKKARKRPQFSKR
jgi:small subunit ribosomal protein S9